MSQDLAQQYQVWFSHSLVLVQGEFSFLRSMWCAVVYAPLYRCSTSGTSRGFVEMLPRSTPVSVYIISMFLILVICFDEQSGCLVGGAGLSWVCRLISLQRRSRGLKTLGVPLMRLCPRLLRASCRSGRWTSVTAIKETWVRPKQASMSSVPACKF